ncbi:MAG: hypothetical protein ACYS3N_03660 [Planctomycetota bacterium]|jgi:hypothetical protein
MTKERSRLGQWEIQTSPIAGFLISMQNDHWQLEKSTYYHDMHPGV